MGLKRLQRFFKSNFASLGYIFFLAISATAVWGGIFLFLPAGFQRPEVIFWLFLAQTFIFASSRSPKLIASSGNAKKDLIEAPTKLPALHEVDAERDTRTEEHDLKNEPIYQDRISKQATLLQRYYRLSARETEVMELIVRGNTVARIAEDLVVSENTIRTHAKRIYAKLSIHKRQELVDLINSFDPHDIND